MFSPQNLTSLFCERSEENSIENIHGSDVRGKNINLIKTAAELEKKKSNLIKLMDLK